MLSALPHLTVEPAARQSQDMTAPEPTNPPVKGGNAAPPGLVSSRSAVLPASPPRPDVPGIIPALGCLAAAGQGLQRREQLRPATEAAGRQARCSRPPLDGRLLAYDQLELHHEAPETSHARDRRPARRQPHHGGHHKNLPNVSDHGLPQPPDAYQGLPRNRNHRRSTTPVNQPPNHRRHEIEGRSQERAALGARCQSMANKPLALAF